MELEILESEKVAELDVKKYRRILKASSSVFESIEKSLKILKNPWGVKDRQILTLLAYCNNWDVLGVLMRKDKIKPKKVIFSLHRVRVKDFTQYYPGEFGNHIFKFKSDIINHEDLMITNDLLMNKDYALSHFIKSLTFVYHKKEWIEK